MYLPFRTHNINLSSNIDNNIIEDGQSRGFPEVVDYSSQYEVVEIT